MEDYRLQRSIKELKECHGDDDVDNVFALAKKIVILPMKTHPMMMWSDNPSRVYHVK